ncbi:MAG: hypothetical protein N0A16_13060 [Blastocatellia bacterium]|nr:hypothetical protein [Blastocatellia bacterium]MCX7753571.1 hypothetical protein [Blastocatellia bacterium]MDW8166877.1 hypothetical protein [Acidobacteriota bacterium]MDW8255408.1 hypothetical protein [Acidobacteriota bacterium]
MRRRADGAVLCAVVVFGSWAFAFSPRAERQSPSFNVSAGGTLEMVVVGDIRSATREKVEGRS